MIERSHLAIVREISRQGTLTAAAASLCVTQSALSHAIRKLEQRLGTSVWARDGRRLRLTAAGRHLLSVADRVLPQLQEAEAHLQQLARGERGTLRIGMECHPCYQWLLKVVAPYLAAWPRVDVDVRQAFQFGGINALSDHQVDLLVTPDPMQQPGLHFEPVFDYEQVLVVARSHRLARQSWILPEQLANETLITYPVSIERLDIYTQFLLPAGVVPQRHKVMETTDIMLQMVACGRGVTALPRWLVREYPALDLAVLRLGRHGIPKQIHLGTRHADRDVAYLRAFVALARHTGLPPAGGAAG